MGWECIVTNRNRTGHFEKSRNEPVNVNTNRNPAVGPRRVGNSITVSAAAAARVHCTAGRQQLSVVSLTGDVTRRSAHSQSATRGQLDDNVLTQSNNI